MSLERALALADLRMEYGRMGLAPADCADTPQTQLERWLREALDAGVNEPSAMNLATVDADGHPNARIVLLKGLQDGQLTFFTNYDSRKGICLAASPWAAATFFWPELERQVRIEGTVTKLSPALSDAYFASRPHGSRIGALASRQSQPLDATETLQARWQALAAQYPDDVPRPAHWGGYGLTPVRAEFWQGRPSRLHDRVLYLPSVASDGPASGWTRSRLQP